MTQGKRPAKRPAPRKAAPVKKRPRAKKALMPYEEEERAALKAKKFSFKKMSTGKKIGIGVALFFALIMYYGLQPLKGSLRYGVCRTYVELQLPYPETLQVNAVDEFNTAVRVFYSHIDAFGASQLHMVDCEFGVDPQRGLVVTNIMVNRNEVPRAEVERFNMTVPYILSNPPNLVLPRFRSNSLADLKINYN